MSETKWTPGPWSVADRYMSEHDTTSRYIEDPRGGYVARVWNGRTNEKANAHLIAAAPDLYAALEAMVAYGREHGHGLRIADEALAKARGEAA